MEGAAALVGPCLASPILGPGPQNGRSYLSLEECAGRGRSLWAAWLAVWQIHFVIRSLTDICEGTLSRSLSSACAWP